MERNTALHWENPGLEVKVVFEDLERRYLGWFNSGWLRTLQRRVKPWRAEAGPGKEVYFHQAYEPGERAQSDFTCMNKLGVTIQSQPFKHMLFHFVLAYSNWEARTICKSESFEAVAERLQNVLTQLGGVPRLRQADPMSWAIRNLKRTEKEGAPLRIDMARSCGTTGWRRSTRSHGAPTRTGKLSSVTIDSSARSVTRLPCRAVQTLKVGKHMRRFWVIAGRNADRDARLKEDQAKLRSLPERRLNSYQRGRMRVTKGALVPRKRNWYSANSRLIGELVDVRIHAERDSHATASRQRQGSGRIPPCEWHAGAQA